MKLEHIDHVALSVSDPLKSLAWYRDVLGLERRYQEAWGDYPIVLCAGESGIALFPAKSPTTAPDHSGLPFRHIAFRASRVNFEQAKAELRARGIAFEFQDHKISHSVYFFDPDGFEIELTTYELQ